MKNVTKELNSFAEFLNLSWDVLNREIEEKDESQKEQYSEVFMQANWELLVEMKICADEQILDYYASGADLFPLSYRVIKPEKNGNSRIVVSSHSVLTDYFSGEKIRPDKFDFFQFVSSENGQYFVKPPFDMSLVESANGRQFLFQNKQLEYFLAYNS